LSSLLTPQNFKIPYQPSFLFSFFIHPLLSNLKLNDVEWREKRCVYSVLFFCKVSF
jgi:hypothetical protein